MSALAETAAAMGAAPVFGTNTTLFRLIGADLNSTADQAFVKAMNFNQFIVRDIMAVNASGAISLATGGIYTAAAKGGTAVVAASQAWNGLTSSTKVIIPAITPAGLALFTGGLFLSLTTPMGSAGTCDIYIMGVAG